MSSAVTTQEPSALDNYAPYNSQYNTPQTSPSIKKQSAVERYPTLFKWIIKIGTVILGLLTMLMGILTFVTLKFDIKRLFAGMLLILGGFLVVAFEAPILCSFVKCIEPLTEFSNNREPWQKVAIYIIPAPIIIILAPEVVTIFGACFLIVVAVLYLFFTVQRVRGEY